MFPSSLLVRIFWILCCRFLFQWPVQRHLFLLSLSFFVVQYTVPNAALFILIRINYKRVTLSFDIFTQTWRLTAVYAGVQSLEMFYFPIFPSVHLRSPLCSVCTHYSQSAHLVHKAFKRSLCAHSSFSVHVLFSQIIL